MASWTIDENLFENRTEDEELAPYADEKAKNQDAQREKEQRDQKRRAPAPDRKGTRGSGWSNVN